MTKTPTADRIVWAVCACACGILLATTTSRSFLSLSTLLVFAAGGLFLFFRPKLGLQGLGLQGAELQGAELQESLRPQAGFVLLLLVAALCGAWRMEWRESTTGANLLAEDHDAVLLSGRVVSLSGRARGTRLILEDVLTSHIASPPRRVSLRYWGGSPPPLGSRIEVVARLLAPSAVLLPQGFDFRRAARFRGIDAYGAVKQPYRLVKAQNNNMQNSNTQDSNTQDSSASKPSPRPSRLWLVRLRHAIGVRLDEEMGRNAAMARALLIGERDAVARSDLHNIRDAGLAHILAISGLHLGLFAFGLFVLVRRVFSLFPRLCQTLPVKKVAASLALFAAFAYMLLAGATLPTQRAFVMSGLVLVAVLCDRAALSLRVVALAALVVLALNPESIASAGFHMSFAAAAALVAFYESFSRSTYRARLNKMPFFANSLVLLLMTTAVASLATAPFVLYHFGRIAQYGMLSNLLAVPLLGAIVLPFGALAILLMPLGWESPALFVMGWGLRWIRGVAEWTSSLPDAVYRVEQPPLVFLVVVSVGLVLVVFGAGRRVLFRSGWVLVALAWVVWLSAPSPLALLGGDRESLWLRSKSGVYWRFGGWQEGFEYGQWVRFSGGAPHRKAVGEVLEIETSLGVFRCEKGDGGHHRCRGRTRGGVLEAGVGGVRFVCDRVRRGRGENVCRDVILKKEDLAAAHAIVLYATQAGGIVVKRARAASYFTPRVNR